MSLLDTELQALLEAVKTGLADGKSYAEAFETAARDLGLLHRVTFESFKIMVRNRAKDFSSGADALRRLAREIEYLIPATEAQLASWSAWLTASWTTFKGWFSKSKIPPKSGTIALGAILRAAAILAVAGGLIYGGVYMAKNWGKPESPPIAAGVRMETAYVPIRVHGIGHGNRGVLSVRTVAAIESGLVNSQFRHGGRSKTPARIEQLGSPMSREEATKIIARMIAPGTLRQPAHADGYIGQVNGTYITIDDWGATDFAVLRRIVAK